MLTGIEKEITFLPPTWRGALRGALGAATTTFVVMEGAALAAKFILGEDPKPDNLVNIASGVGTTMLALRGLCAGLLTEPIPFSIRAVRATEVGGFSAALATGFLYGLSRLTDTDLPPVPTVLFTAFMTSLGLIDGWNNLTGGRGLGFPIFSGHSLIPFKS